MDEAKGYGIAVISEIRCRIIHFTLIDNKNIQKTSFTEGSKEKDFCLAGFFSKD